MSKPNIEKALEEFVEGAVEKALEKLVRKIVKKRMKKFLKDQRGETTEELPSEETTPVRRRRRRRCKRKVLTPSEGKVLRVLKGTSRSGKLMNRAQVAKVVGFEGNWTQIFGRHSTDGIETNGHSPGLVGKGFVEVTRDDDNSKTLSYYILEKGREILERTEATSQ